MFARHVTVHGSPDRIHEGVRVQRENVVPVLRECEGFQSSNFPGRPRHGRCRRHEPMGAEADMLASEAKVRPVRQRVAQQVGASPRPTCVSTRCRSSTSRNQPAVATPPVRARLVPQTGCAGFPCHATQAGSIEHV